jgi:hypothetical protein
MNELMSLRREYDIITKALELNILEPFSAEMVAGLFDPRKTYSPSKQQIASLLGKDVRLERVNKRPPYTYRRKKVIN